MGALTTEQDEGLKCGAELRMRHCGYGLPDGATRHALADGLSLDHELALRLAGSTHPFGRTFDDLG